MNSIGGAMQEFEVKFNKTAMPYRERICKRFGWKDVHLTLNGHTIVGVKEADMSVFMETVRQHYLSIIERL